MSSIKLKLFNYSDEETFIKDGECIAPITNNFAAEPDQPIANSSVYRREKIVFSRWH
ncbi:MAG: hypothetical protein ACLUJM_11200 [Finegoldia sp.]|uniref:hypothetical protein n=1 Tax=Finegoldia sp. TaxID=1981334 RepID=UPI003994334B